jgi:hypothetical protein
MVAQTSLSHYLSRHDGPMACFMNPIYNTPVYTSMIGKVLCAAKDFAMTAGLASRLIIPTFHYIMIAVRNGVLLA